jgi:GR25 family glycosyltransferase involved in LPS biosynthesis
MKFKIIRLKNNKISEDHAKECIDQAARQEISLEIFDGINGLESDVHLAKLGIRPKYKFKKGKPGVTGCLLSHYYLWLDCVKENVAFCIVEHDGYFIRPLPADILEKFSEVLKLDNHNPYSKSYNDVLEKEKNLPQSFEKYYNPDAKSLEKNGTGNYIRGTYGYIIKPIAAKKLIDWIKINGFLPSDNQIGDAIVDIQVAKPSILRLHPAYFRNTGSFSLTQNTELLR